MKPQVTFGAECDEIFLPVLSQLTSELDVVNVQVSEAATLLALASDPAPAPVTVGPDRIPERACARAA